jgi:hypothetical protein
MILGIVVLLCLLSTKALSLSSPTKKLPFSVTSLGPPTQLPDPTFLYRNHNGRPRAASALAASLNAYVRIIIGTGAFSAVRVCVDADSNVDALLGKWNELSIRIGNAVTEVLDDDEKESTSTASARTCVRDGNAAQEAVDVGAFVPVRSAVVQGSNLRLGILPTVAALLLALLPAALLAPSRTLRAAGRLAWIILLYKLTDEALVGIRTAKFNRMVVRVTPRRVLGLWTVAAAKVRRAARGAMAQLELELRPSTVHFSLLLSESALNRSWLLRLPLQLVLTLLMREVSIWIHTYIHIYTYTCHPSYFS